MKCFRIYERERNVRPSVGLPSVRCLGPVGHWRTGIAEYKDVIYIVVINLVWSVRIQPYGVLSLIFLECCAVWSSKSNSVCRCVDIMRKL